MDISFFLLGSIFGSFITMLSYRIPIEQDIIFKRSYCPKCVKELGFFELIPIFSWLYNFGRCFYCKEKIPVKYILTEIITACAFLFNYKQFGLTIDMVFIDIVTVLLITIIIIDLEHYIIPDSLQIALLLVAICWIVTIEKDLMFNIIKMLGFFLTAYAIKYLFIIIFDKDGLGWGDVKFIGVAGLYLSWSNFAIFLFLAGIFGVIFGLIWQNLFKKGEIFPFAPSLALALYLCITVPYIINWQYYSLLVEKIFLN